MNANPEIAHRKTYQRYIRVWLGLILLTGITASVAGVDLGLWNVLIALAIAGTKSGLVMNYFMHLGSEKMTIFRVIIPLVVAVFVVFIILTFSDEAFRGGPK